MTTDNPTEAARTYAEQACYQDENRPITEAGFRAGWKAARTRLAAQEPTEDEVLAVARLFYRTQCGHDLLDGSVYKDRWMNTARAALSAARTARRDGETR